MTRDVYNPAHRLDRVTDVKAIRRFLAKVDQIEPDACWRWTGCKTRKNYGRFHYAGKTRWSHRLSYAMFVGPIPEGMTVDHKCFNAWCCNPDHLQLLTYHDNCCRKECCCG